DDLLVLKTSATEVLAYPGAPRIKLFPAIAKTVLDSGADVKMNADTGKLIIALKGDRACAMPVPLAAIYVLAAPRSACRREQVSISLVSPREGCVELIRHAFNRQLSGRQRLERQFALVTHVAKLVPMKTLAYARAVKSLQSVRETVLDDLRRGGSGRTRI